MGELERFHSGAAIERFGMSTAMADQLDRNFVDRGQQMAALVMATLTETPYKPTIGTTTYGVDIYSKHDEMSPDLVVEAREAVAEAERARAPGMAKGSILTTFKTGYEGIAYDLHAKRKDGGRNKKALNDTMVESVRSQGVLIPDAATAYEIIAHAPKKITGLELTRHLPGYIGDSSTNRLITTGGHEMDYLVKKEYLLLGSSYSDVLSKSPRNRGGRPPRSTIVSDIRRRMVELRTKKSER